MPSRPFDFRLAIGVPTALMFLLLCFEPVGLDFMLARVFYRPDVGFIGRRSFWLEDILHDKAKQAVILFGLLLLVALAASVCFRRWYAWRRPLAYLVLSMGLCTAIVTPLKALTGMHCPWSLAEFGGDQPFKPLLSAPSATGKPGRCWPGGHASTGFSLLALFFVLRDRSPRAGRWALAMAVTLGGIFSLARMAQGAHFLSHNLWTLLIDWLICTLCYRLILYRQDSDSSSVQPVSCGGQPS